MPLPENFNHWEHLQDTIRREHNKAVARYFKDLGDATWEPTVNTPREALRTACTIQDIDTVAQTHLRLYLFYDILGYGKKRLGVFYGIPKSQFDEDVNYKPQIVLEFSQDSEAVPEGKTKVEAEISFRLMDETAESLTKVKATNIAKKIKSIFVEGNNKGYVFSKGKIICSYIDKLNGYRLRVYASTEAEGLQVIKKVLQIQAHTYDDDKFSTSTPKKNSINNPTKKRKVYEKQIEESRWRPTANVRFRCAYISIEALPEPIHLVDTQGYLSNPILP